MRREDVIRDDAMREDDAMRGVNAIRGDDAMRQACAMRAAQFQTTCGSTNTTQSYSLHSIETHHISYTHRLHTPRPCRQKSYTWPI